MEPLQPFYKQVQAHYDLSNEFFALFSRSIHDVQFTYFEPPGIPLAEAQQAKIELAVLGEV